MDIEKAKRAIYSLTYGVYVITTRQRTRLAGMTAVWVTQVSKDPLQVVVGLTPDSATTRMLLESRIFAVNVLARDQKDLAYAMGRNTSDEKDKFAAVSTTTKVTGAPILNEAIAYLDCKVVSETKLGSHWIVVGEVVDASMLREGEPAVYRHGRIF